ncbi:MULTISPECIES: Bug family tripartite tricarboxylate transporter substrate binding protein [Achromobacter]|uniref:Tripartite tricarboxylate transporter substrate binding protein n=1 Tax=Alcaligenes xylosoxydans xylosoxydans TaxID=85698 RepID=A0A424W9E1_ALCXX|nr:MULTISPECIES: tripartite tricarboxylate transporter substrate binding protein [Achromobacter]MBC9907265.1 tripartite tricarboxylate transporter substrate binding protein [Achromobacter xylosoxidans]MBD0870740.1 tripartite tricarboxylate transporter substrate binding protein [Achromobacter xylosoxidans]QNP86083.1 tripartite tricarboxylate transporter substrate binding protein [Achromobacter xylosoxidans]RPJ89788.1 tripartite tricarboxylate transporter substrate binding protein [Achromobacter 
MIKHIAKSAFLCALAVGPALAAAQDYPSKPITMVVPFPPGGSTDVIGRLFAAKLGDRLRQTVVVENKPGANTGIGAAAVARAAPDGYTFMITGAPTFTLNPLLYPNLNYDPIKSYEYVAIAGSTPFVILTNPQTGIATVADIKSKSAAQPLSFGSFGNGSTPHIAGESLAQRTGAKLLHVPYRGSAPAMADLLGNQIPLSIDTLVAGLPQIKAGKARAVALTGNARSALVPDVPTVAEGGVANYDFETWFGVVMPKGTPAPIVARLSKEIEAVMAEPDTRAKLEQLGFDATYADPAAFRRKVETELERNVAIIKAAGIKPD